MLEEEKDSVVRIIKTKLFYSYKYYFTDINKRDISRVIFIIQHDCEPIIVIKILTVNLFISLGRIRDAILH